MTATRDLVADLRDQLRLPRRHRLSPRDEARAHARDGRGDQRVQGRAGLDAPVPPARLRPLRQARRCRPGPTVSTEIDFDKIVYYRKPSEREEKSWDDVPEQIKATFERLGIPEAERKFLAGVGAQYDSEVVYHSVKEELTKLGVVFMGTDQALKEYPEIFRKHFGTVVPPEDNKFSALNAAVWSGGSFVYVPKGVEVPLPLQAYFRINGENTGQFERTLIVVDEGAKVHYIEGCTAPDLRDRLAPRRRRRGRRPAGLQGPLHDDPELVERRLQPRHQARPRVRELDGRVDRREHGLAQDREVPVDLPARRERHGRHHQRRGRRQGPAPGHRREGDPPRAQHALADRIEVGVEGRRPGDVSRPAQGLARAHERRRQRPLRRADARRHQPQRHVPLHRHPGRRHDDDPRGHRRQDQRRTRSST